MALDLDIGIQFTLLTKKHKVLSYSARFISLFQKYVIKYISIRGRSIYFQWYSLHIKPTIFHVMLSIAII